MTSHAGVSAALAALVGSQGANAGFAGEAPESVAPPQVQAPPASDGTLYIGDSVATGLGHGGAEGNSNSDARWGRGADRVLELLQGRPEGSFAGKNVVLSSGVLNSGPDWDAVRQQIGLLRDRGASVQLVGAPTGSERFAGYNDQLKAIAEQNGASFLGGYDAPDGVHPVYSAYPTYRSRR